MVRGCRRYRDHMVGEANRSASPLKELGQLENADRNLVHLENEMKRSRQALQKHQARQLMTKHDVG
eukprot:COSAG01_NODE_280_length_19520_cov_9.720406_17_plen_66_part_00